MIEAVWKQGYASLHGNADAQKVANEITALGEITPANILDAARDENTELHKCFEWDDTAAAEKYRLFQARQIVCHLVIKQGDRAEDKPEIRLLYRPEGASSYKQTEVIVTEQDEYQRLLARALAELQAFKRKYSALSELEEILELI